MGIIVDVTTPMNAMAYYLEYMSSKTKTSFTSDKIEQIGDICKVIYIIFIHHEDKVNVWATGIDKPQEFRLIHATHLCD